MILLRHLRVRRDIEAFLDGELDSAQARRVRDHVSKCWPCSGHLELMGLVRVALRRSRREEPSSLALRRLTRFSSGLTRT